MLGVQRTNRKRKRGPFNGGQHSSGPRPKRTRSVPKSKKVSYGGKIGETKYVDAFKNNAAITVMSSAADGNWASTEFNPNNSGGALGCLPVPSQGNGYSNRDGRKFFMKNIRINGLITWPSITAGATLGVGPVRIIIVKDTRTNQVSLSGEDVIGGGLGSNDVATLSGDGNGLCLPTNPKGWGRYRIMYDRTFEPPLASAAGVTAALHQQNIKLPFSINIKANCEVNMDDVDGTIANVVDNSFHMLCACQDSSADALVGYYARTSFVG